MGNHGSLSNRKFFGVRNHPGVLRAPRSLPLARGMNRGFSSKIDQKSMSPPASQYTQEALRRAKHPPTLTRTMGNHGSLSNRKFFRARNRPGVMRAPRSLPLARGMNSGFSSKIDQKSVSPPASQYKQEALRRAKHPPTVTRTMANHGSLPNEKFFGGRNRPGAMRAFRGPLFGARHEQRFSLQNGPKQQFTACQPVHTRGVTKRKTPSNRH
jgi:hypothetical protein